MCGKMDLGCHITEGFQSIATSALDQLRDGTNEAAIRTLNSLASFWFAPKSPELADESTWADSHTVGFMHDSLLWITGAVFLVAITIAGMRTAWEQRAQPLQELLKTTLIFVAVSGAGTAVLQLLTSGSDAFAAGLIKATKTDPSLATAFGGEVDEHGHLVHELVAQNVPTLLAISLYGTVILASLVQVVLMLVRSAMLVLLAGTFPLAAAATNTEIGKQWFRKYCSWALAFVAYKPAAALVYAAALQLSKADLLSSGDSILQAMTGVMMLLLSIFALPALLRFMVPVTAAVAGGGAGAGAAVADPGGLASGAINVGQAKLGAGASGGGSAGGGASGAQTVGAAGAGLGTAGVAVNAARKAAGGLAGAAAHSAGEAGGGSVTPTTSFGPMSRGGGGRSGGSRSGGPNGGGPRPPATTARAGGGSSGARTARAQSTGQARVPEPTGPSGNW